MGLCSTVGANPSAGDQQGLNLTAHLWQGPPRSFFSPKSFECQERVCHHDERRVVVPAGPASPFVMVQSKFFLQLLIVLLPGSAWPERLDPGGALEPWLSATASR